MWGVVDVSVWTNPCLSVQNIVLSRENPLAAGYSKADLPELQPLYCIIWKAVAGRADCAMRVESNGREWSMGCRKRHLEFTVNLLSWIEGNTAHCCSLFFNKSASELLISCFSSGTEQVAGTIECLPKCGTIKISFNFCAGCPFFVIATFHLDGISSDSIHIFTWTQQSICVLLSKVKITVTLPPFLDLNLRDPSKIS